MALFGKKDPCPICGGKVKGLFKWKIEGQAVCNDCHGFVDLPEGMDENLTLDSFREYKAFRDENDKLRDGFNITNTIDFGWFDDKIVFDTSQRLMCMSKSLDKTIFKGSEIKSFVIREDGNPLFEGGPAGLCRHASTVRERAIAMTPMVNAIAMQNRLEEIADRLDDDNDDHYRSSRLHDIPEPFKFFYVDIQFDHPYWKTMVLDKKGPEFLYSRPDVTDYLNEYDEDIAMMEELAHSLMAVAFPNAAGNVFDAAPAGGAAAAPVAGTAQQTDPVEQIMRYKSLLDRGIISQEEFDAKKRQLMGL